LTTLATDAVMPPTPRFEDVTETTGIPVTTEGARMMYTRYAVAAELAAGRHALEVACGGGNGLGLVSARARGLVGGDYSAALLAQAKSHYGTRIPLVRFSAEALPFRPSAFDIVLFFEASYYIPHMERAFDEVARVLAPQGTVLFINANPERPDFVTSPHAVHYHSADELRAALEARGFDVTSEGAFPVEAPEPSLASHLARPLLSWVRRMLQALRLVPRTLRGRARLKRLIYRHLVPLPAELPASFSSIQPRIPTPRGPVPEFKVIYVTGRRNSSGSFR
jgi:SAM-dependent methyltransferase